MRFKLIGAAHSESPSEGGKRYKRGDVIESTRELDKTFAGKFIRLDGPQAVPQDFDKTFDSADKVMDKPLHRKVNEEKGEEVEDDEEASPAAEGETEDGEEGEAEKTVTSALGKDVTNTFGDLASAKDLKVFKKGLDYSVTDADDTEKALNQTQLRKKADVEKFLGNYKG